MVTKKKDAARGLPAASRATFVPLATVPQGFTPNQMSELHELGVTPQQLERLQGHLSQWWRWLHKPVALSDVRDGFTELNDALRLAGDACRRFGLPSAGDRPQAVWQWLVVEHWNEERRPEEPGMPLDALAASIDAHLKKIESARQLFEQQAGAQARHRAADPRPVVSIHRQLLRGWRDTHGLHAPPFPHAASTSPTSAFRQIVGLCYGAMSGQHRYDPKRAIEAAFLSRGSRNLSC